MIYSQDIVIGGEIIMTIRDTSQQKVKNRADILQDRLRYLPVGLSDREVQVVWVKKTALIMVGGKFFMELTENDSAMNQMKFENYVTIFVANLRNKLVDVAPWK